MFFWWHVDGLAHALKAKVISEKDKSLYLLGNFIFVIGCIIIYYLLPQACLPPYREIIHSTGGILYLLVIGWGIFVTFQTNRAGDNNAYIERFICLAFPIGLRIMTYFLLVAIPLGFLRSLLPLSSIWGPDMIPSNTSTAFKEAGLLACMSNLTGLIVVLLLLIWFFLWMRAKISFISGAQDKPNGIRYIFIRRPY